MKNMIRGLCVCAVMATALALQAADDGTMYLKVDAGLSIIDKLEPKNGDGEADMDMGFRADVAGGYKFAKDFALELEVGLAYNEVKDAPVDLYQIPILASVVYTVPLESKFKPFVGVGAGGTWSILDTVFTSEDAFSLAIQGQAGVSYEISEKVDIGVAYKLLANFEPDFGVGELDTIYTHSIMAVLTLKF